APPKDVDAPAADAAEKASDGSGGGDEGGASDGEAEKQAAASNGAGDGKATTDDASVSAGKTLEGGGLEIGMPEMGESVTEGTVPEWHVAEGDQVAEGDTVVEVSTDKVDAEVPAPASGTITKLLVEPDETIEVGKPLAEMTKGEGPTSKEVDAPAADAAEKASD